MVLCHSEKRTLVGKKQYPKSELNFRSTQQIVSWLCAGGSTHHIFCCLVSHQLYVVDIPSTVAEQFIFCRLPIMLYLLVATWEELKPFFIPKHVDWLVGAVHNPRQLASRAILPQALFTTISGLSSHGQCSKKVSELRNMTGWIDWFPLVYDDTNRV